MTPNFSWWKIIRTRQTVGSSLQVSSKRNRSPAATLWMLHVWCIEEKKKHVGLKLIFFQKAQQWKRDSPYIQLKATKLFRFGQVSLREHSTFWHGADVAQGEGEKHSFIYIDIYIYIYILGACPRFARNIVLLLLIIISRMI